MSCCLGPLLFVACAVTHQSVAENTEQFVRRSCKFRPLPVDVNDGFQNPDGSVQISDVFGVPAVALARGGHNIQATVGPGMWLGASVQVPFATGLILSFEVTTETGDRFKCRSTYGAGGRMKQCTLARVALGAGKITLSFRASGVGDAAASAEGLANPTACVSVRVDLEISTVDDLRRAEDCSRRTGLAQLPPNALPPLSNGNVRVGPLSITAPSVNDVVWFAPIPPAESSSNGEQYMVKVNVRITFPSVVRSAQLLLEEVTSTIIPLQVPRCNLRCVGGTPITNGQVLHQALPLGPAYVIWLLAPPTEAGQCVNVDFTLSIDRFATGALESHYLGPPPWLCEGSSWPTYLEQVTEPAVSGNPFAARVFKARRFALNDVFDITRPPEASTGADVFCRGQAGCGVKSPGQLHTIGIKVIMASVLRVNVQAATLAARPVLVPGDDSTAWQHLSSAANAIPVAQVPAAGGEVRHSIHADLHPGTYTLVFVTEFAVGGLRPCSSIRLRLELDPDVGLPRAPHVHSGPCSASLPKGFLNSLARQVQGARSDFADRTDRAQDFQLTFPVPADFVEPIRNQESGLEILAREPLFLDDAVSTLVRATVTSPFLEADLHIQIYANGEPLAEPQLAPDGNGYQITVGPLGNGISNYELVLFHVPRRPLHAVLASFPRGSPVCVTFSVDIIAVKNAPPTPVARLAGANPAPSALPGTAACDAAAPTLPTDLHITRRPTTLEGEFLLPSSGQHFIQIFGATEGDRSGKRVLVRAVASSDDAEVRLGADTAFFPAAPQPAGLIEDRVFSIAASQAADGRVLQIVIGVSRLPMASVCPTIRIHIVAMYFDDVAPCSLSFMQETASFETDLREALAPQDVDRAGLRFVVAPLPAARVDVSVPFTVDSAYFEIRLELGMEPAWLPLEMYIESDSRPSGPQVIQNHPTIWGKARVTGQRLALLMPNLPKGNYVLHVRTWSDEGDELASKCSQIIMTVAALRPSGRDTSNYRQEMLNLPDLLAVIPLPDLLIPTWLPPNGRFVAAQMYAINAKGAKTVVTVQTPSLLRVLAEPADILTPKMTIEVRRGTETVSYPSQLMGSMPISLNQPGTYELYFAPIDGHCNSCPHLDIPFFFTIGLASVASYMSFAASCADEVPSLSPYFAGGPGVQGDEHSWRRTDRFRLSRLPTLEAPLKISRPSVVLIAAWSSYVPRYVRIGLKADVGLWVGEQRLQLSALEIELPPGDYKIQIDEPSIAGFQEHPKCVDFGVSVSTAAFTPKIERTGVAVRHWLSFGASNAASTSSGSGAWGLSLGARCEGLGASPLPLDFLSASGGSISLGGPVDPNGRLLIRHRMLLTDIHDGRKKVFFKFNDNAFVRISVASADAAAVEMILEDASHHPLSPTAVWSHGSKGWSMGKRFEQGMAGVWLSFHREHRDALLSGCAAFDLLLQLAPLRDLEAMTRCDGSSLSPQEWLTRSMSRADVAPNYMVRTSYTNGFDEVIEVSLATFSLLEVEVQYNFLLSFVDVHHEGIPSQLRAHPAFGAVGGSDAALNAHSVLQLRLPPGVHKLRISHESTGWRSAREMENPNIADVCIPLRLIVRHAAWLPSDGASDESVTAVDPSLSTPVSYGNDLVVAAVVPHLAAAKVPMPLLAGVAPTGSAQYAGGVVGVWDHEALQSAITAGNGRVVSTGISALPLRFSGVSTAGGEVLIATEMRSDPPWAGGLLPTATTPERWTFEFLPQAASGQVKPQTLPAVTLGGSVGPSPPPATAPPAATPPLMVPPLATARLPPVVPAVRVGGRPSEQQPGRAWYSIWWIALLLVIIIFGSRRSEFLAGLLHAVGAPWSSGASRLPSTANDLASAWGGRPGKELPSVVEVTQWAVSRSRFGSSSYGSSSSGGLSQGSYGAI